MKSKILQYAFPVIIVILICMIFIYSINDSKTYIRSVESNMTDLVKSEKQYIKKHRKVTIYVPQELRHLMGNGENGFLQDYMNSILKSSGMEPVFTCTQKNADCSLAVVTDELRNDSSEIDFTAPVFQMEGALLVREGADTSERPQGIIVESRSKQIKEGVFYNGVPIDFVKAENVCDAVAEAEKKELDFILGDRSALLQVLGDSSHFIPSEEEIYSLNVCLVTDSESQVLGSVLNKYIHAADRHRLSYEAGQKWLAGNGPVYMKSRNEDIYMIILIIFTAVMIVFFIYYHTNKNLYDELNDRMEKLAESKKELKTTFNGVSYMLAELELDGRILDMNPALYNMIHREGSGGKIWEVLELDNENSDILQKIINETVEKEKPSSSELMMKHRILETELFPIENAKGSVEKLLFMSRDSTSEVMAERQLLQDNKMIAVGQLAAGVAHEIRNPLGIIRNYCYLLKNTEDEAIKKKAIDHIEKAVDNSGAIINNLLNFSRVSKTRGEYIDVEEHIRSLMSLNANMLKKKNINLEIICPEAIRTFISVESLDMILINLISNAADAMNDDGNLTIKMLKYSENFEIAVEDTGIGISEDILQDIFNPFFTTKGNNKGNGLGLYIVYNETGKLNGKIEVQSKEGEGSVFKLTIPLHDDGREEANDKRKHEDTRSR